MSGPVQQTLAELSQFEGGRPGSAQRQFRLVFYGQRTHSLGKKATDSATFEDVVARSVQAVRASGHPDFVPKRVS